jgi:hypothetical protein
MLRRGLSSTNVSSWLQGLLLLNTSAHFKFRARIQSTEIGKYIAYVRNKCSWQRCCLEQS